MLPQNRDLGRKSMSVDTVIEDPRWEAFGLTGLAEAAVSAVLAHLGYEDACEVVVMGCSDARIAELNADFRGKPQPTNVLSWPSEERGAGVAGDMPDSPEAGAMGGTELGDIAIAYETCEREAADAGKPMRDHCLHLLVHGSLHLLGFDHERDPDATLMEGIESEILGKMGLADPYRDE